MCDIENSSKRTLPAEGQRDTRIRMGSYDVLGWLVSLGRQLREEGYLDQALQEYERALFVSQRHQQMIEGILLMKCLLGEASGSQSQPADMINDLPGLLSYIESIMAR
jgi:hypothetical protein